MSFRRSRGRVVAVLATALLATGCTDGNSGGLGDLLAGGILGWFTDDTAVDDPSTPTDLVPGQIIVSGATLPELGSGLRDPAAGMQAPVVTGADADGATVVLGSGGGPTAIVFLAHWCPHCQAEVPRVQDWLDSGGGVAGVDIISVATAIDPNRPNHPPEAWLDGEGWTAPVLMDDDWWSAFEAYGGTGFPFWVFLDASGKVVRRTAGELEIDELRQFMQESVANA